jgi:hypothetical protein
LKQRAFSAAGCGDHCGRETNTLATPGLNISGMSTAKKENFLLKLCNQID